MEGGCNSLFTLILVVRITVLQNLQKFRTRDRLRAVHLLDGCSWRGCIIITLRKVEGCTLFPLHLTLPDQTVPKTLQERELRVDQTEGVI